MNKQRRRQWLVVPWVIVVIGAAVATAEVAESELESYRDERGGLVAIRDGLRSAKDLHSNWTGPPCHGGRSRWYGVSCDGDGRVVGVALDGVQLTGALPAGALRGVTRLATLSLRDNAIHDALPRLDGLDRLRVVDLSSNRLSGPIPRRYAAALPALRRLELQDNLLNGTVPAFAQGELIVFNVSYNLLQGEVPDTRALRRFPASAFGHNLKLCGEAVNAACRSGLPSADDGAPAAGVGSLGRPTPTPGGRIALIVAMVSFAVVLIFLHQTKKSRKVRFGGRAAPTRAPDIKDKAEQAKLSGSGSSSGSRNAQTQLQFFRGGQGCRLRLRPRRVVPFDGGDAGQGAAGDHLPRDARGRRPFRIRVVFCSRRPNLGFSSAPRNSAAVVVFNQAFQSEDNRAGNSAANQPDPSQPWLFDTGAIDHLTNDMGRMNIQERYTGTDQVQIANGAGLSITHVGHSRLSGSSSPLSLKIFSLFLNLATICSLSIALFPTIKSSLGFINSFSVSSTRSRKKYFTVGVVAASILFHSAAP